MMTQQDTTSSQHVRPVPLDRAYRLLNIGPTVIVSARDGGDYDAMAAAWSSALDLAPTKGLVVLDKSHYTRRLVEKSNRFMLSIPTRSIVKETLFLGSVSKHDDAQKIERSGVRFLKGVDGVGEDVDLIEGCAAWVLFERIPEPHNEEAYDLFVGTAVAAWADERIFSNGRWHFEDAPEAMQTVHYVAGGRFYAIGDAIDAD